MTMRRSANSINSITTLLLLSLGAAMQMMGCASGGPVSSTSRTGPDPREARASDAYFEGLSLHGPGRAPAENCLINIGQTKGADWKMLVRHANGCIAKGDWKSVEMIAGEIAGRDIESPWGVYYLSLAADHAGDLPRALWMAELAMKKAPAIGLFGYQKGRVLWKMEKHRAAVEEIQAAVKHEPRLVDAHLFLGQVYARDQQPEKSAAHFQKAAELDPSSVSAGQIKQAMIDPKLKPSGRREPASVPARRVTK